MVQRKLHQFNQAPWPSGLGYRNGINNLGAIQVLSYRVCDCGLPEDDPVHNLPAATEKPKVPSWHPGDRVEWDEHPMSVVQANLPAGTGTVKAWRQDLTQNANLADITVECDDCSVMHTIKAKNLRKLVPVPKFASIEEAQAWLEQNA